MKKQVKFAENQMVHRLHHNEALPRSFGINRSEMALTHAGVNFNNGWKINRPRAAGNKQQLQHLMVIQIPKSMTAAPFLKHAALSPAQKEYLYTIASSYSPAHVRSLITQHYMNVLHRSVQSGQSPDRDGLFITSATSAEREDGNHQPKAQSEDLSRSKHKGKINARYPGKSVRTNIPNRKSRSVSASKTSKHKKTKKQASASQSLKRKSPKGSRIKLQKKEEEKEEEEEEEEGPDDSLSECLSSLSMEEWDDDNFSDL